MVDDRPQILEKNDKRWLCPKSRVFDSTYGANWSHIQLDITWLSHLIKMTQKSKNPIFYEFPINSPIQPLVHA